VGVVGTDPSGVGHLVIWRFGDLVIADTLILNHPIAE